MPLAIGIALTAAITSAAWWALRPASTSPPVTRFAITLPEGQTFTGIGRQVLDVSRDGTQIVYAANRRLYRRTLGELDAIPIAGSDGNPTGVANPVFSPDGRWVAFVSVGAGGTALQKIPSGGGAPQMVANLATSPFGLSWSTEGILVGGGQRGIFRVSPNGGALEEILAEKPDQVATNPRMLPGGDAVLYTRRGVDFTSDAAEIVVHSLKSGKDTIVVPNGRDARYVDGHLLYAVGGVVFAVPFDLKQMKTTGDPVPVINGVARAVTSASGAVQFSLSENGALVYVPGPAVVTQSQFDLALIDRTGRVERLMLPAAAYEAPRVSPDGKQIAVSASDNNKEAVVLIYDLSGKTSPRRLTFGGRNRYPIWSGDGQRVAFQSDREGELAVFVQRMDGNGQAERLTTPAKGTSHVPDSWSPDGEHLLFSEIKGTEVSSWIVSVKDKQVSPFGDIHSLLPIDAVFSPSGKWVAYQQGRSGDNAVYVQPFPPTGTKYQVSKGPAAHHPAWSGDKEIVYIPSQANAVVASVTTQPGFAVGKTIVELPAKGLEGGPGSIRSYDVMPDGRLLAVVNAETQPSGAPESPQIRVVLNWFEELKQKVPTEH
jgi:Tol biopolymer transport system component